MRTVGFATTNNTTLHGTPRFALTTMTFLMAASALAAGFGMINGGVGIPDEWLNNTPFTSWVLPGIALLIVVGLPQTAALATLLTNNRNEALVTFAAGALLMGWIVVQFAWMQRFNVLQPICFLIGTAELIATANAARKFAGGALRT